jgi:hypothetical protein
MLSYSWRSPLSFSGAVSPPPAAPSFSHLLTCPGVQGLAAWATSAGPPRPGLAWARCLRRRHLCSPPGGRAGPARRRTLTPCTRRCMRPRPVPCLGVPPRERDPHVNRGVCRRSVSMRSNTPRALSCCRFDSVASEAATPNRVAKVRTNAAHQSVARRMSGIGSVWSSTRFTPGISCASALRPSRTRSDRA